METAGRLVWAAVEISRRTAKLQSQAKACCLEKWEEEEEEGLEEEEEVEVVEWVWVRTDHSQSKW